MITHIKHFDAVNFTQLALDIKAWARELGFQQVAIADTHLKEADQRLQAFLDRDWQGDMYYLANNREKRTHPEQLVTETIRVITARMDYLSLSKDAIINSLSNREKAYISNYALGRDYHKVIRKRLYKLAEKINEVVGAFQYRAFTDSAPVFEKPLAEKSGLGWMGKNTLILNREAGSWFFLGELYTNLPLAVDTPVTNHCGSCSACIDICPTNAIEAPYQLNATKCISYLTIEHKGSIPLELRPLMGNRIFGCDDCQLICPWNKFAKFSQESDFKPRHALENADLITLFLWTEEEFLKKTEGSAIRRTGYIGWLRNIAVALGNAPTSQKIRDALLHHLNHPSELVREHVQWAIEKQKLPQSQSIKSQDE